MTFFNIFSKKEEKIESPLIVVDYREKNALVVAELVKRNCQIRFEQLEIADYILGNTAIERKTVADLKSSIINKRLVGQLSDLKKYEKYALVIEGIDATMYEKGIHENALRGFLLSVAFNHRVPIIYTLNEEDTAKYLVLLSKERKEGEQSIRASKPAMSDEERIQFIMEGFPSIGPVTAKKLLKEFKSIQKILTAPEEEIKKCIGKKSEELIRLFKKEYKF